MAVEFTEKDKELVNKVLMQIRPIGQNEIEITNLDEDLGNSKIEDNWIEVEFAHSVVLLITGEEKNGRIVRNFQIGLLHTFPGNFYEPPDQQTVFYDFETTSILEASIKVAQELLAIRIHNVFECQEL